MKNQKVLKALEKIKRRNIRVESDKAWETSWTRRIIIAIITYVTISIFLLYIKAENPFVIALIPAIGYVLSTFSMPVFKKFWIKNVYRRKQTS